MVAATVSVMASLWIPHLARFDQSNLVVNFYRCIWIFGLFAMLDAELRMARSGLAELPTLPIGVTDGPRENLSD